MPIDYGILNMNAIQKPNVQVIQTPNYAQQNAAALSQAASQIQQQNQAQQQLAMQKQELQMKQQMFPGELKKQGLMNQEEELKVQDAQRTMANTKALQDGAAADGLEGIKKAYIKQGNGMAAEDLAEKQQNIQKLILGNKSDLVSLNSAELKQKMEMLSTAGNFAFTAKQQGSPEAAAAFWSKTADPMMDQLGIPHPKQYDENWALAAMGTAHNMNTQISENPYLIAKLYPDTQKPKVEQQVTQYQEMRTGITKARITAEVNATQNIAENEIKNSQIEADKGQKLYADASDYENNLNKIQKYNTANPTNQITLGPGFTMNLKAQQAFKMAGISPNDPTMQEILEGSSAKLQADAIAGLKIRPTPEMMKLASKMMPNGDQSVGAQLYRAQFSKYAGALGATHTDFLGDWRDTHQGSMTGAETAWLNFQNANPTFQQGKLPDINWLSPENYKPFLDRAYKPPKPGQLQGQQPGQAQAGGDIWSQEAARRGL